MNMLLNDGKTKIEIDISEYNITTMSISTNRLKNIIVLRFNNIDNLLLDNNKINIFLNLLNFLNKQITITIDDKLILGRFYILSILKTKIVLHLLEVNE